MANQAEIDALTQALQDAEAGILAEIQKLEEAHPEVDLTGLKAEVEKITAIPAPPAAVPLAAAAPAGAVGQVPANADGTAQQHTEDPAAAQEQAAAAGAGPGPGQKAEDAARQQV